MIQTILFAFQVLWMVSFKRLFDFNGFIMIFKEFTIILKIEFINFHLKIFTIQYFVEFLNKNFSSIIFIKQTIH